MSYLKKFLYKNKGLAFITTMLITLQTVVMLYLPYLIAEMINQGIIKGDNEVIFVIGLKMLITLVLETVLGVGSCYLAAELASRFGRDNRQLMVRKIQKMTVDEVGAYGIASLVTRFGTDNVNVQQMIVSFFQMVLPGPIIGFVAVYMTFILSPELALIPLTTIGLFLMVLTVALFESVPYISNVQRRLDQMTKVFREFLLGVRIIRAFDQSVNEKKRVDQTFNAFAENNIKINILFAILSPVAYTLMLLAMSVVIWLGAGLVAQDYLGIGEIPAVLEYTAMSIGMLIVSSLVLFQLPKSAAALNRISEIVTHSETIIEEGAPMDEPDFSEKFEGRSGEALVSFEKVTLTYGDEEHPAISDISFQLKRGQTVAIIGPTGSGKTTIIKALLRLTDCSSGVVSVQGVPVERLSLKKLRDMISYVPQRNFLFSGTIKENISFKMKLTHEGDLVTSTKLAQAFDFITQTSAGFETQVSQGGTNFSGGQKQRLAIARAVFKKAPIYVFDDSFSALDYATDFKVRQGLKEALASAGIIIVAQRIQSIIDADTILVMSQGKIIGRGRHQELLATNRHYQQIAKSQGIVLKEGS